MTCWVRVRLLSAIAKSKILCQQQREKISRGRNGAGTGVGHQFSTKILSSYWWALVSQGQVVMEGELERSTGWSEVGEEEKSSEFRTDVRKCFFLQKLLSMWNGSWQYCWCNDAGPAPGAVKCGGGNKEQRDNKGWLSMAWRRYCPVLSYLKHIQMCFELSFDISLHLQKENSESKWSAFVACPAEKMIFLLYAFLDSVELIRFVMWLCKHWSAGGFACASVAICRWVMSCQGYVERSTLRSLSCCYRVCGWHS